MIRIAGPDNIGHILRTLRTQQHLRQWQLAEVTGYRQGEISAIERGVHYPALPRLIDLAEGLGYELALVPKEGS